MSINHLLIWMENIGSSVSNVSVLSMSVALFQSHQKGNISVLFFGCKNRHVPNFYFVPFIYFKFVMAKTKKSKWSMRDDCTGGRAHQNVCLNLWDPQALTQAIAEYNSICTNLGSAHVLISKIADKYGIPKTTFWKW